MRTTMATENNNKTLNVPNLRFPEFSGEWERSSLGVVFCKVENGLTYDPNNSEGLPVTRIETISDRSINYKRVGYAKDDGKLSKYKMEPGDILFSHINSLKHIGKTAYYDGEHPLYHGMNLLLLRTTNEESARFLFYQLNTSRFLHRCQVLANQAVNQASINTRELKGITLHKPSIKEQIKIADFISLLDNHIATQIKIIEKLESLIKGLCSSLFDKNKYDSFVRLGDISEITNGNSDVQDASLSYSDGMYPFFDRSEDIKFLPEYLLDKEAIIYPGEGSEFYPRYYNGKFALHQRCYAIYDIAPNFATRYLYFFCKTQNSYFVRNAVGSTVASLRLDTFKRLNIPNIPIELQKTYVQLLDKIETKIVDNKIVLKKYEEQKRYLLSNLFI